jgi:hypothetical protein
MGFVSVLVEVPKRNWQSPSPLNAALAAFPYRYFLLLSEKSKRELLHLQYFYNSCHTKALRQQYEHNSQIRAAGHLVYCCIDSTKRV